MKIAVASEQELVSGHFGHCSNFNIYDTDGKTIISAENIVSPGHDHNLIDFLDGRGVNVIISGGMGAGAREKFDAKGIRIVTGAQGAARDAVQSLLDGSLVSDDTVCCRHEHASECHH
ncbi:MAG: NifB/NifX family molybdenum-iron cluster-binding protein [Christensenella sp.]|nr:NifB/NifX family molybdenum-iron cluster-binding protein [Christensenella sp.]